MSTVPGGRTGGLGALVCPAAVPVTICSDLDFNASASRFNGRVDEVAIYNRALTANEVFDIYDADRLGKIVFVIVSLHPPDWSDGGEPRGMPWIRLARITGRCVMVPASHQEKLLRLSRWMARMIASRFRTRQRCGPVRSH
jgi:hypothetical protein